MRSTTRHSCRCALHPLINISSHLADAPTFPAALTPCPCPVQLRERGNRLEALEAEVSSLRQQCAELREENVAMTKDRHLMEKAASAKDVELSALKQSINDKEQLNVKVSSLLEAANDAKRHQQENLTFFKDSNAKLQAKVKASSGEIVKGNQIISKLQADVRALRGKLRLKAAVMLQQQDQATQKQQELEASERTVVELRAQLTEVGGEKERALEGSADSKRQLAEAQELIRSNQQIIQWLNKELNDAQTGPRLCGGSVPSLSLGAQVIRTTAFRPTLPPPPMLPPALSVGARPLGDKSNTGTASDAGVRGATIKMTSGANDAAPQGFSIKMGSGLMSSSPALRSRAGIACISEGASFTSAGATPTAPTSRFSEYLSPSKRLET